MKYLVLIFSGFLLSGLFFTSVSCQKDTDCKATIKCVDSVGNSVPNANVQLYAQIKDPNDPKAQNTHTADVKASGTTDGGGEVKFTFKLPAILDVKATASVGTKTISGQSIIKLEEGKNVDKTVTMK